MELKKMIDKGMSQVEIAKKLGITRQAVSQKIKYRPIRNKKDVKIIDLHSQGLQIQEIADRLDYTHSGIRTALVRLGLHLPVKEKRKSRVKEIIALWKKGHTNREIMKITGMSESHVGRVLLQNNLPYNKKVHRNIASYPLLKKMGYTNKEIAKELKVGYPVILKYKKMTKKPNLCPHCGQILEE
jgi:DNA-binding CsgD family transcriptional regulator